MKNIFMGFKSSSVKCCCNCPLIFSVWVDFVVVTGFVQRCCEFLDLVFVIFFSFLFIVVCFRFVTWRWRSVWLYIGYVIWFESIKYVFLHWRYGFLVLVLFYWMHISIQLDRFYLDVARKGKVRRCSVLMVVIVHHTLKILSVVVPSCVVGELWYVYVVCSSLDISWLRLKFEDHCNSVDSVLNWLFMACSYFERRCWNLDHLCVGRRSIRLFKCS